jgi:hypothetical protein
MACRRTAGRLKGLPRGAPGASAGHLFSTIQTDWYWRVPAVRLADTHASNARAADQIVLAIAQEARALLALGH